MFRILDRYVIRELVLPLAISLALLTFMLVIPPIIQNAQSLITKGVGVTTVAHVFVLLLPQALSLTIPMSVLLGILIGFGRLSADREFVAMQASGVSLYRLLRPVAIVALLGTAAAAYEIIVALPDANQTFREITFNIVASHAESNIVPRVFDTFFPNQTLYVRDAIPGGGWRDVFLADTTDADRTTVYFAKEGRLTANREQRTVLLELKGATRHTTSIKRPDEYEGAEYATVLLNLDADRVFPKITPAKGVTEMSIAELKASLADAAAHGDPGNAQRFMIQQKFAFPVASIVLAVVGLALGATHRKSGGLASFTLGFLVIIVYYVILYSARAASYGGRFSPTIGPWIPNIVFAIAGAVLLARRARSADQPIRIAIPFWGRREPGGNPGEATDESGEPRPQAPRANRVVVVIRVPHIPVSRPSLLDLYISREYVRTFTLAVVSLLGIFYISTFMDVADKLFRGVATSSMLVQYLYFLTPQYIYYIIPMSALVATLVTVGVMTKNSELIVMRACGVSLYRAAAPIVLFALAASSVLFLLQERVVAYSNQDADRLNRLIRGYPPASFGALDRRWMIGQQGDLYHYRYFDPNQNQFNQLTIFHLNERDWGVTGITRAAKVQLVGRAVGPNVEPTYVWSASDGWTRRFSAPPRSSAAPSTNVTYSAFNEQTLALEPPSYFKSDEPNPDTMTYGELKEYVNRLQEAGYNAVPFLVSLQTKLAFPLVTVVMALLAVPFAVTTGRRGALYGIGAGIVIAIAYRLIVVVFAAVGSAGLLPPWLAAWAPNLLFAAAAGYLLLTVRT